MECRNGRAPETASRKMEGTDETMNTPKAPEDIAALDLIATLRERINGLGTVIQSQIDEIVTLKERIHMLEAKCIELEQIRIQQQDEIAAPDRAPMP